jgi:hypothetical protein
MPVLIQRLTVAPSRILVYEVLVAIVLHVPRDAVECEIPGDSLELVGARRPVARRGQARRRVHDVEEGRALRTQRAAIDRVIGIALDVDNAGSGILGTITHAVNQNAAGNRAVGAGVARLGCRRQLERPHRCGQRPAGITEPERS